MSHLVDLAKMANDVYKNVRVASLLGRWTVSDTLSKGNLRLRAYRNTATRPVASAAVRCN